MLLINHRFFTKRSSIIFFQYKLMRVESPVFPPFIAKRVKGIFGCDILFYGFFFRKQWGSFPQSLARISLLFIKWRRVKHNAARARSFSVRLARSIPCAAVYKLRFTLEKQEQIDIYVSHSFQYIYIFNINIRFKNDFIRWFFWNTLTCTI